MLIDSQSLFGMNIKDPIWGPIIPQGVENELSDNSSALENSTTAIARNQTDAITSAIATSGGYLWSFKIYWTIAAPVTFVTILLPLIAGPAARYIVKFSYHNRAYSRIILSLLGVAGEIIMAIFVPVLAYLLIFGLAYGALAVTMLFWTSASGQNPLLWATFAAVYAYSLLLDLSVEKLESVPVTGVVPLIFLIIVLFQSDIRRFLPARGHKCIAALLSNTARQRRKLCWVGIIVYYILVSVLITFASSVTWQIIIIPLLILAINRLVYEWTHEGRINHWFCYAVLLSISAVTDSFTIVWLLPYLPMTYIFTVWVIQEHKGDFLKVLRRIRN